MKLKHLVALTGAIAIGGGTLAAGPDLAARQPIKKRPDATLMLTQESTGRLIIKFIDQARARVNDRGRPFALGTTDLGSIEQIFENYGLRAEPQFKARQAKMDRVLRRAAERSGRAQPDLAGMMFVYGPVEVLEEAALALNHRAEIEFVAFEKKLYPGGDRSNGARGFVSVGDPTFEPPAGPIAGTDGICTECADPDGDPCGDCFDPDGNGTAYCADIVCCDLIGELDAFCIDIDAGEWDAICAAHANMLCPEPGADPCLSGGANESCYVPHQTGGCNEETCCNLVGAIDESCIDDVWDDGCAAIARATCQGTPDDAVTPDYSGLQGYATAAAYDPIPAALNLPIVAGDPFFGYAGEGYNLFVAGEDFVDDNGNGWWDVGETFTDTDGDTFWTEPGGIWGLAERLLRTEDVNANGQGNQTRGNGLKIGIIEWGYWVDHEDLDVILEPGQRLFQIDDVDFPNHGTACLGIVNATDQGALGDTAMGMVGLVPEAQAYFFPLTSINEGPRQQDAWLSALDTFAAGDVISASYGPAGSNLNENENMWALFRVASDLGIGVFIAAGNDCANLDDADDLGDSGCTVVGASSPGTPHYRLLFSNYGTSNDNSISNRVHLKGWGSFVATLGYGDLFVGEGAPGEQPVMERSYTSGFGGTSAASPMVAANAVALQGFARQFFGISLAPEQIRGLLQAGDLPPNLPAPRLRGGFDDGTIPCSLDSDINIGPNWIGEFPAIRGAAVGMIQQSISFDDSPLIDNIVIVRGTLRSGNFFSVKGLDGLYLRVESIETARGDSPMETGGLGVPGGLGGTVGQAGFPVPQIESATYLAGGLIADVVAVGTAGDDTPTNFSVQTITRFPPVVMILVTEAYDWNATRWAFLGVETVIPGADPGGQGDPAQVTANADGAAPRRFIHNPSGRLLVRVYAVGFPGFGDMSGPLGYDLEIDLIDISLTESFGEQ